MDIDDYINYGTYIDHDTYTNLHSKDNNQVYIHSANANAMNMSVHIQIHIVNQSTMDVRVPDTLHKESKFIVPRSVPITIPKSNRRINHRNQQGDDANQD